MEYLLPHIKSGALVLLCPNCKSFAWGASGLGQGLLHCNKCWTHTPLLEWVTSISLCGDDDPYICLRMMRSERKFSVQVDTSQRESVHAECIRFCVIGGQRSPYLLKSLAYVLDEHTAIDPIEIYFTGSGEQFKVFRKRGFLDIWAKTEDVSKAESAGVVVSFEKEDKAVIFLESLIASMLEDLKHQQAVAV